MPHQIAKQQQQLIQQQHKINLLQQQIQVMMAGPQAEGGTGLGMLMSLLNPLGLMKILLL